MIVGHLGIAGATYARRRDSSLFWLLGASMAPDVVDGVFVVAKSCNPYGLYSHTIPAAALIAAVTGAIATVTGAIAYFATGQRVTGLLAVALVAVHLPLDFITGHKLFWPGGDLLGLRLYEYPLGDFALEALILLGGWWLVRSRRPAPRWATGWLPLAALLLAQGTLDVLGARGGGTKPSACATVAPLANY